MSETPTSKYREAKASTAQGAFGQTVEIGPHRFTADEPPVNGGNDAGPAPHEWVLAGLASCVAMTVQGYAKHKGLPREGTWRSVSAATAKAACSHRTSRRDRRRPRRRSARAAARDCRAVPGDEDPDGEIRIVAV